MTIKSVLIDIDTTDPAFGADDFERGLTLHTLLTRLAIQFRDGDRPPNVKIAPGGEWVGEVSYVTTLDFWGCNDCLNSVSEREVPPQQCLGCGSRSFSVIETAHQRNLRLDAFREQKEKERAIRNA